MKEQDLIQALGSLPQDMLDELDEWQKSGTPLTGAEPETDAPARTGEPVITQRRNQTMKQKTEKAPARLRAWTAGIAAAVVLCAAVAVPVGREAVRRAQQSNAGYAESEPAEPVTEVSAETWIVPDGCTFFHWEDKSDLAGYYDCLPADTKLYAFLDELGEEQPPLEAGRLKPGNVRHFVYGEDDEVYDIYFIGLPMQEVPDDMRDIGFLGGTLTQSGKLHLNIGALTDAEHTDPFTETAEQQYAKFDTALLFAVPEGELPEITEVSGSYIEYPLADLLTDAPADENERAIWYSQLIEKNLWIDTANGEPGIRLIADEPAEEILTAEQPDTVPENPVPLLEQLITIGGSDYVIMKVPQEGTVQVLHSVAEAEACCQYTDEKVVADQNFDFRRFLTEDVFAQYDVLYFAHKDNQQPLYLYAYDLAGGSIAADGTTLQLDFHALIYDPEHLPTGTLRSYDDYEPDWNTYYFYTVPKGSLPDLNTIEVRFSEYLIGEIPDDILTHANDSADNGHTAKLPEYVQTTQGYLDWKMSIPEQRYITRESAE
ncbi:MAG: hypothetical protein IKH27_08455 [Oscillospiraceae bacterium]|nr:hypothetical protein [Oscillospiraceae bacterium]